jgi:predicted DNA-binding transcriptional regulator AlpA
VSTPNIPPEASACAPLGLVPPKRYLSFDALKERGLFSNRVSLDRAIKLYGFPRPFKLGARRVAWCETEVDAWVQSRRA